MSEAWLARIGGSLAMAVILFLLLLRYYVTPDSPFGLWTLPMLLPVGLSIWLLLELATRPFSGRLSAALIRMQARPIEITRVRGVSVLLDRTCILPALAGIPGVVAAPAAGVSALLSYYAVLLLHESGHAVVAMRERCHVYTVEVHALHGMTTYAEPSRRDSWTLIAWGGVVAQMLVAIPASACLWMFHSGMPDWLLATLVVLGPVSTFWVVVNLLPIRGLDGELAWQFLRRKSSRQAFRVVRLKQPRWQFWKRRRTRR